jgi:Fe-Mn family superoxide dismutase
MIEIFTTMEKEQNGSGWAWLVYAKNKGTLEIKMTMNNDQITEYEPSAVPLLIIDMWEHAFYNDYSTRSEYLQNIWSIIDWKNVAKKYDRISH